MVFQSRILPVPNLPAAAGYLPGDSSLKAMA
jgi:hypothetical protein